MRVLVEDDHGRTLVNYSTMDCEGSTGPNFSPAIGVCIAALAEAIGFLSPDIETQAVALSVETMAAPDSTAH